MTRINRHNKKARDRLRRQSRIRKKIIGTSESPRLCVHRSLSNFHAQLIDDIKGATLLAASTSEGKIKKKVERGGNKKAAAVLGALFAERAVKKGYKKVRFDRAGYAYHGRVKEFAEAARKGGLLF